MPLAAIIADLAAGILSLAEAVVLLGEIGIIVPAAILAAGVTAVVTYLRSLGGGTMAACVPSHGVSSRAPGPGVCCAALSAAGFGPGNAPPIGTRVAAVNKNGKCIICEVRASTSRKNPGAPVIKKGKSHVAGSNINCPTTAQGCCALAGL
jgi:hypothetical protein